MGIPMNNEFLEVGSPFLASTPSTTVYQCQQEFSSCLLSYPGFLDHVALCCVASSVVIKIILWCCIAWYLGDSVLEERSGN